jgi:hypothetical protein
MEGLLTVSQIINITFCGRNAGGNGWHWTHCIDTTKKNTCEEFVADNPEAFRDTFFLINSIKLFQI